MQTWHTEVTKTFVNVTVTKVTKYCNKKISNDLVSLLSNVKEINTRDLYIQNGCVHSIPRATRFICAVTSFSGDANGKRDKWNLCNEAI